MMREPSTMGEADIPAKKQPKKLSWAAACNTKFDSKWCSKYPATNFLCCGLFSGI